ncbi:MAG: esterase-like activity of phytase family protein [Kiloniellaceae bacterium]
MVLRLRGIVNSRAVLAMAAWGLMVSPLPAAWAEPLALTARVLAPGAVTNGAALGRLRWMGGLELSAPDRRFGGLSGLLVSADGRRLTAVSDRGYWVAARLAYDGAGRLAGVGDASIAMLRGTDGLPLRRRWDQDAESLAVMPDGAVLVGFEHNHRLWRYPAGVAPLAGVPMSVSVPAALTRAGRNSGLEALTDADGDAVLAVMEGNKKHAESAAYLWRDGAWRAVRYARGRDFRPTGATRLPDGDILLLERRFNLTDGIAVRLRHVPGATLTAGAKLYGALIATLAPPAPVDNMEGIAARRTRAGATMIYLISDDNYSLLQRTLLLMFELRD